MVLVSNAPSLADQTLIALITYLVKSALSRARPPVRGNRVSSRSRAPAWLSVCRVTSDVKQTDTVSHSASISAPTSGRTALPSTVGTGSSRAVGTRGSSGWCCPKGPRSLRRDTHRVSCPRPTSSDALGIRARDGKRARDRSFDLIHVRQGTVNEDDRRLHQRASQRSDLNAARISSEKSSGSSQAAKWPPLSTLLK